MTRDRLVGDEVSPGDGGVDPDARRPDRRGGHVRRVGADPGHLDRRLVQGVAFGAAVEDSARLLGSVLMYALIGTTVAVLVRSTPVALGPCLLWFPDRERDRREPGMVLRSLTQPGQARRPVDRHGTLAAYVAMCVAVIATVMARLDVTA